MSLRRWIVRLGPYPSLLLLALPTAIVEPLKLAAVAVGGKGHWITGTAMIVACYAFSLLVIERLFKIVKPKLLTISWFAKIWNCFGADASCASFQALARTAALSEARCDTRACQSSRA